MRVGWPPKLAASVEALLIRVNNWGWESDPHAACSGLSDAIQHNGQDTATCATIRRSTIVETTSSCMKKSTTKSRRTTTTTGSRKSSKVRNNETRWRQIKGTRQRNKEERNQRYEQWLTSTQRRKRNDETKTERTTVSWRRRHWVITNKQASVSS